jgi:uncharacterized membrane protein YjgN (DUF898 family)
MGRVIALLLLVGYTVAGKLPLYVWIPTFLLFVGVVPWLIVSSARFNARNTSYRNVRFEFVGDYLHALGAYVGIFVPVVLTLGFAWPMAHRERQYFYINNHKYGGKRFATEFSGSSIYAVYFEALLFLVACGLGLALLVVFLGLSDTTRSLLTKISANRSIAGVTFLFAWMIAYTFIRADVFLLSINNMVLNGRFKFIAVHSPWKIVWLWASNLLLVLLTAGLLYPWARVRMTRYMVENVTILADSDFESFTSEVFAPQSAGRRGDRRLLRLRYRPVNDSLPGRYFLPGSARFVPARAEFRQGGLRISDPSDAVLAEAPLAQMQISARLGNMPRRFSLTDGACFETDDNDAADALLKQSGRARVGAIHRIEQSWRWVAASVLLAGAVAYVFVVFGIPAIALWLARETPQSVNPVIAAQELAVLDRAFSRPRNSAPPIKQKRKCCSPKSRRADNAPLPAIACCSAAHPGLAPTHSLCRTAPS